MSAAALLIYLPQMGPPDRGRGAGRRCEVRMTMTSADRARRLVRPRKPSADEPPPIRTSELLRRFARDLPADRVTLGEIIAGLGDRGLGVLIAVFALPNILPSAVPFGNVPNGDSAADLRGPAYARA